MIVTRSWLNEFIPLSAISDEQISQTFVRIGHEIASVRKIAFDDRIVVGKIAAVKKHESAEKLSVCEVDVGDRKLTIVCGASNVEAGRFVPVATIGAKLPDGDVITEAKIRGVKSFGMICSSKELGLGALNDGILHLDNSIGELKAGAKLNDYPALADTVFEAELTANRGDCSSVYGLARELCAALETPLSSERKTRNESARGIGRILNLTSDREATASVLINALENRGLELPLTTQLRLELSGVYFNKRIDALISYATLTTGVLFRAYDLTKLGSGAPRAELRLVRQNGLNLLIDAVTERKIETIGIEADPQFAATDASPLVAIEAFFAPPEELSKRAYELKLSGDALFNRASKGSEPDLARGTRFLDEILSRVSHTFFYSQSLSYAPNIRARAIAIDSREVSGALGRTIAKNQTASILKRLGASVQANGDQHSFLVTPPAWRHDLTNEADLIEEVMRISGIDAIDSKPLLTSAKRSVSVGWRRFRLERSLANRAAASGFNESLHFVFCDQKTAKKFGFKQIPSNLNIANPIASNLNALRPTLLINLAEAAAKNRAKGRSSVRLFEIGDIYDENRVQSREIAFIFSGEKEAAFISNRGKTANIDLFSFASLIAGATLDFALEEREIEYLQSAQSAKIVVNGEEIGEIGKLNLRLVKHLDLSEATFTARINLDKISDRVFSAKTFSRLQPVERDLSVVVDKKLRFGEIKEAIASLQITDLKRIAAIDVYDDGALGQKHSLTLRLVIHPFEKTLSEERLAAITDLVLTKLNAEFGAVLR
ncbi:MAG: phenylalanine--tRNA ligase subunit beta [Helicobacteraceae bacterium]|jgi:phenylalanyl-tRNA synthetase beta chain|nr:phenylalanine--tRNA ligase subunit beta [Helicobacteraceae bacterium]